MKPEIIKELPDKTFFFHALCGDNVGVVINNEIYRVYGHVPDPFTLIEKVNGFKILTEDDIAERFSIRVQDIPQWLESMNVPYYKTEEITKSGIILEYGKNIRDGKEHIEYHAPCGCAFHQEPKPHWHPCKVHK